MPAGSAKTRLRRLRSCFWWEDEMMFTAYRMRAAVTALLVLMPATSFAQDQQYSVRNESGQAVRCGIRNKGSSAIDDFTLKAGAVWTRAYSSSKMRLLICEGTASTWQAIDPGRSYRVVKAGDDRIIAEMMSGH
jgi:hypothetical protein